MTSFFSLPDFLLILSLHIDWNTHHFLVQMIVCTSSNPFCWTLEKSLNPSKADTRASTYFSSIMKSSVAKWGQERNLGNELLKANSKNVWMISGNYPEDNESGDMSRAPLNYCRRKPAVIYICQHCSRRRSLQRENPDDIAGSCDPLMGWVRREPELELIKSYANTNNCCCASGTQTAWDKKKRSQAFVIISLETVFALSCIRVFGCVVISDALQSGALETLKYQKLVVWQIFQIRAKTRLYCSTQVICLDPPSLVPRGTTSDITQYQKKFPIFRSFLIIVFAAN